MRNKGFTLIEVIVALLVVAIALPALLAAVYRQVDGTAHLRDRVVAQWVAAHRLEQARLQVELSGQVDGEERSGVTAMAGRDWRWRLRGLPTEVPGFYRLEVTVAPDVEGSGAEGLGGEGLGAPLHTLTGFVASRPEGGERGAGQ